MWHRIITIKKSNRTRKVYLIQSYICTREIFWKFRRIHKHQNEFAPSFLASSRIHFIKLLVRENVRPDNEIHSGIQESRVSWPFQIHFCHFYSFHCLLSKCTSDFISSPLHNFIWLSLFSLTSTGQITNGSKSTRAYFPTTKSPPNLLVTTKLPGFKIHHSRL